MVGDKSLVKKYDKTAWLQLAIFSPSSSNKSKDEVSGKLVVRLAGIFISILCCHPVDVEDWSKKAIPLHWQAYLSNCWRALSWQLSIRLSVRCGLMVIGGKTRRRGSIQEGVVTSLLTDRWRVAAMPPFYPSSKDCMESHPCSSSACLLATAYLLHIEDLDDRSSRFYCVPPPLLLAWNGSSERRKESLTRRRRLEWASFLGCYNTEERRTAFDQSISQIVRTRLDSQYTFQTTTPDNWKRHLALTLLSIDGCAFQWMMVDRPFYNHCHPD